MKKIISLIIIIVTLSTSIFVFSTNVFCDEMDTQNTINNVTYVKESENGKTFYSIMSFENDKNPKKVQKEITVLEQIDGIPVRKICNFDFHNDYNNSIIETINLPDTIEYIDSYAFLNMKNLKKINIPKNIKILDENAFRNCTSLEEVVFPKKKFKIRANAFWNCKKLKKVDLGNVTMIEHSAFYNCKSLKKLKLPKTLKVTGYCFLWGTPVTSLVAPKNLHYKGNSFNNLKKLKTITFKSLDYGFVEGAFYNCKSLKEVHLESVKKFNNFKVGSETFSNTKSGIKFFVRNKKLAKILYNGLNKSKIKSAKIYVNKKLIYKTK